MDESVRRAIEKWPNVPAAYGWLSLNRRGDWLLQGERVINRGLIDFINRHYQADQRGAWYFQNGPQQVFVELEYTPLVYFLVEGGGTIRVLSHTQVEVREIRRCWIDEQGSLLLETDLGPGAMDDRHLVLAESLLRDAGGKQLTTERLEEALTRLMSGAGGSELFFSHQGRALELASMASAQAPRVLGFDPHPGHKAPA